MVIAKVEWFKSKEKGFGYKTWQGNVFLLFIILILFSSIFLSSYMVLLGWILCGLFLFLFFDCLFASVKAMDERDQKHYSIAMRNVAWSMLITMIVISMISTYFVFLKNIMWFIYITGAVGFVVGTLTKHKLNKDC